MKLKLKRKVIKEGFTEGKLYINDGFECYTVEDTDRKLESGGVKVAEATAIPRGVYDVTISKSNRFNKFLIEILNVQDFTGVRIHSGNSSKDTEGCIIVGSVNTKEDDDWVGSSRVAYEKLHSKVKKALSNGESVTLEVV